NDNFMVVRDGSNDDISLNGNIIWTPAISSLTTLTFSGLAGADTLMVDSSHGDPYPSGGISYHGGNNLGGSLVANGGFVTPITENSTTAGPGHSGNIHFDSDVLTYDGLAPVDLSGEAAQNVVFNLPGTANAATLGDSGSFLQLCGGGTFEATTFATPSTQLTI